MFKRMRAVAVNCIDKRCDANHCVVLNDDTVMSSDLAIHCQKCGSLFSVKLTLDEDGRQVSILYIPIFDKAGFVEKFTAIRSELPWTN